MKYKYRENAGAKKKYGYYLRNDLTPVPLCMGHPHPHVHTQAAYLLAVLK